MKYHMLYEPDYRGEVQGYYRVFAYIQSDRKVVVVWQKHKGAAGWQTIDDHVCEDMNNFIDVWQERWL